MATEKRGVARDTWRSKEEARAELTRLQQSVVDLVENAKDGEDLSLLIMALVMVSTDENDTLQPLRTGTADGLAWGVKRVYKQHTRRILFFVQAGELEGPGPSS